MILADTSLWVDHLRASDQALAALLDAGRVLTPPFVIGELALGNLCQRDLVLTAPADLPRAGVATDEEVLHFIECHALFGRGVGYIDAHLLAAVQLEQYHPDWNRQMPVRVMKLLEQTNIERVRPR